MRPLLALVALALCAPAYASKRPSPTFGLGLGPSVGLSGLGLGPHLRVEAGVTLPKLPLTLSATGAWTRWSPKGEIIDERLAAGSATWALVQDDWAFGVSGAWGFGKDDQKLRPEAGLALGLAMARSRVDGDAGGEALGTSVELAGRPGGAAWGGARYALGPGALVGRLELGATALNGQITGEHLAFQVAPMVGYRVEL